MTRSRKLLIFLYVTIVISVPRLWGIGNDVSNKDSYHYKDVSYVFMKEFEVGNYSQMYLTVQPGAITIYTNIIGYKGLYFLKDKIGIVRSEGKKFDLLMHRAQKVPKELIYIFLALVIFFLLQELFGSSVAVLFTTLLALEPYFLGMDRLIMTDSLPAYLIFILALYMFRISKRRRCSSKDLVLVGAILGLSIIEKASSLVFLPLAILLIYKFVEGDNPQKLKKMAQTLLVTTIVMIILYPPFWGDFWLTWYRITVGSYIQGIEALDFEKGTFGPSPHSESYLYYLRFLYNKVSEFVFAGIVIALYYSLKDLSRKFDRNYWSRLIWNPLMSFPLTWFILHEIANKKTHRFMTMLFPFLVLLAVFGIAKIVERKFITPPLVITLIVALRYIQFSALYPDFLFYKNPLSIDREYKATLTELGSGRKRLAEKIERVYGPDNNIVIGDSTTFELFYPGEVFELLGFECNEHQYDLVVTGRPLTDACLKSTTVYDKTISVYDGMTFDIYRSNNPNK